MVSTQTHKRPWLRERHWGCTGSQGPVFVPSSSQGITRGSCGGLRWGAPAGCLCFHYYARNHFLLLFTQENTKPDPTSRSQLSKNPGAGGASSRPASLRLNGPTPGKKEPSGGQRRSGHAPAPGAATPGGPEAAATPHGVPGWFSGPEGI